MEGGDEMRVVGTEKDSMKVVVGIDDSEDSFYCLKWALDNLFSTMATVGSATPEATLETVAMVFLVHVQPPIGEYGYPAGPFGAAFYTTPAVVDAAKKAQEEASAAILGRALQMCKDKLVKAETMILKGDPREMICQATEQVHADLLVVGSRGLGTLSRTFLGSVSDYCAHNAKSPVLIVKPPLKESEKQ